jgi:hypothetical protein
LKIIELCPEVEEMVGWLASSFPSLTLINYEQLNMNDRYEVYERFYVRVRKRTDLKKAEVYNGECKDVLFFLLVEI